MAVTRSSETATRSVASQRGVYFPWQFLFDVDVPSAGI